MPPTSITEKETSESYRFSHPDGDDFGSPAITEDDDKKEECPHPCTIPINCRQICPFEDGSR